MGSFVDLPGISSFCVYAAWSFVANDILQFLIFVPLMVIDNRRISKKRNFCCPCCWSHGEEELVLDDIVNANSTSTAHRMAPTQSASTNIPTNITTSIGAAPSSKTKDSWLTTALLLLMTRRTTRLMIICLFLCTLSGSIYVMPSIETGSDFKRMVPADSMVIDFMNTADAVWGENTYKVLEIDVVIKHQDFSDITVRDTVYDLMADLESQDDALDAVSNWLDDFGLFLNETGQDLDTLNSSEFYGKLQSFSNGTEWESEIIYDDAANPMLIDSTRFWFPANGRPKYLWSEYVAWNDVFDGYFPSNAQGFVFEVDFIFGFFDHSVVSLTANNMIFAGIGVFVILLLFVDLRIAVFLLSMVTMIDVHLMGWIWTFGIVLDAPVFIFCVLAVGLTVDYLIHITHSIAEAQPQGDVSTMSHQAIYIAKLKMALNSMGVSVWFVLFEICCLPKMNLVSSRSLSLSVYSNGAFTTLLGLAALAFARSETFRITFKVFAGIIVIAVVHGFLLAPALLGEC